MTRPVNLALAIINMIAEPAKRRKGVYKFLITEDVDYRDTTISKDYENDWIKVEESGNIRVKGSFGDGYAWDGCTPKFNILDIFLFGTPDGRINVNTGKPVTYYASLIHDILCQFSNEIGITRKQADQVFLKYLGDFQLRLLYYAAVRTYGFISSRIN